jgi:hypothetical protein
VPLSVILALCMGGIAVGTPLTLYLFWLAYLNRRERPTVVASTWDLVALLAGLSRFIITGSGLLLTAVVVRATLWSGNTFEEIRESWGREQGVWWIALVVYLAALGLAVGLSLAARRRELVAYNVDLSAAEEALVRVLNELQLSAKRVGHLWSDCDGYELVEVIPFYQFRHVTFRLLTPNRRLREELDRRLRRAVADQPAADNPVGPWLTSASITLVIAVLCCVVLIGAAVFAVRSN